MASVPPRLNRAKIVQAVPGATPEFVRALEQLLDQVNAAIPALVQQAIDDAEAAITTAAAAQATANSKARTFAQPDEPTAEGVGDLWQDTDDGNRISRWDGTSWVPLRLNTAALQPSAAADVTVFTGASPVVVTGVYTSPDGFAGVRNTQVCSVSFTARATGQALLIFDGRGTFTNSTGSVSGGRWSIQNDAGAFDVWRRVEQGIPASAVATFPVQTTRRFSVVEGVTYTFSLYASKLNAGDTFEINNFEMRAEVLY